MKTLSNLSKWLHKYFGLFLILFLMWMSLSGVLLNHPDIISGFSVPGWLVPDQYHIRNWNRSALTQLVYSQHNPDIAYAGGKQGVWKTTDGGRSFHPLRDGFPESRYYRKTAHIFLLEGETPLLFAGTNHGLYVCNLSNEKWKPVSLGSEPEPVRKILQAKDSLLVFTDSHAYQSPLPPQALLFKPLRLARTSHEKQVSLVRLFFDLHDGKIWGLPGILLFDITGLILFFLSVSAFYSWYYPWKRKREKSKQKVKRPRSLRRLFKWFLKYHLKLGIWTAGIMLLIGGTGMFMRPPLLAALANGNISAFWYPGPLPDNPWDQKIHNALYDAVEDRILIQATDGIWAGSPGGAQVFQKIDLQVPIFVMGATVFEPYNEGGYLVGSFNGIYHRQRAAGKSIDILTGREAQEISSVRPGDKMVTACFTTPQGETFINTHYQGILPVDNAQLRQRFAMPEELESDYRMPLWNYLFEIHNGRFFKDLIGTWYILLIPLGALFFILITLSGVFDWLYLNVFRKRKASGEV